MDRRRRPGHRHVRDVRTGNAARGRRQITQRTGGDSASEEASFSLTFFCLESVSFRPTDADITDVSSGHCAAT
eukprot:1213850-Rhodomonas_salina.1